MFQFGINSHYFKIETLLIIILNYSEISSLLPYLLSNLTNKTYDYKKSISDNSNRETKLFFTC